VAAHDSLATFNLLQISIPRYSHFFIKKICISAFTETKRNYEKNMKKENNMKAIRRMGSPMQNSILGSRWGFTRTLDEWVQSVASQFLRANNAKSD